MNLHSLMLYIKSILLLFIISCSVNAQFVFPLQVGNKWQYWQRDYQNGHWFDIYGWTEWVERDTVMPNGKSYSIIVSDGGRGGIMRQEGSRIIGYPDELFTRYDFSKTTGDTINFFPLPFDTVYTYIIADEMSLVFGQQKRVQIYYQKARLNSEGIKRVIADGFGLVTETFEPGEIWYLRGSIINGKTFGTITSVEKDNYQAPSASSIEQNYPNPFNSSTTFIFITSQEEHVSLKVYSLLGQEMAVITEGLYLQGKHIVHWDATQIVSGVYYYTFKTRNYSKTNKLVIIK